LRTQQARSNKQGALINTNLKGRLVHSIGVEQTVTLTAAAVTANRIVLDWDHEGRPGHLIAKSPNGVHFSGRYGYGHQASSFECELTLYRSNHEDLLYGTWRQADTEQVGTLILRLPKAVENRQPDMAETADAQENIEGPQAAHSQPAGEGKVAALRLAPGTSGKMPPARPSKVGPKAASAIRPGDAGRPATKEPVAPVEPVAAVVPQPAAAPPPSSASVDHLLSVTSEQFAARDRAAWEKELLAAPVSALFKVAHNALAAEMRGLAGQMFADRYGDVPPGPEAKPPARPVETPEMKARKRRSSRHKTNR
jgi:hypothetical protein